MPKLGDRLNAARRRQFVGRSSELALFQSALTADDLPFYVLHIFGPGGVGKSTLLSAFATQCQTSHVIPIMLDARDIDPTPGVFTEALRLALNLSNDEAPLAVLAALAARPQRHAILIDTYEAFAPLDNWLRDSFLPQLPENTLVVLAGREPPATAWQADPGWSALVRVVPLRNLSPDESRAFLAQRNIPLDQHPAVLSFTHGFPLALALVAETFAQRRELSGEFQPGDAPDIVKTLLERFVQKVPGPAHRAALEACALVRVITESLLGDMLLTGEGAHGLFEWLRSLSFIDAGHDGLFPHDLAREALIADVRWRNPDWYAELHKRARAYYTTRIAHTTGLVQQRLLFDLIFLHRDNAVVRPFLEWRASGNTTIETVRPAELEDLIGLVQKLEGDESARYAAHWFARQPQALQLLRDPEGGVAGFVMLLSLNQASLDDLRFDPGTHAVWSYLQKTAPLRSGEIATLFRFWLARDTYQAVSPTQSLIFVNIVRHYLTTPGLAYTFFPAA
ncbi:MAG TPA: ATP-binding protein, partial [Anaerolineae bacterium]|nr:ATP-binding protein [Anaerolineae bacterium]